MARFGAIPTGLDIPAGNFVRQNAGDDAFEAAGDVVIDGDFASQGICLRGAGAGSYSIMGGSAAIDTVEASLTDDATHMPTSAAVYAAIASNPTYWSRAGTTLSPTTEGDDIKVNAISNQSGTEVTIQNHTKFNNSTVNALVNIEASNSSRLQLLKTAANVVHLDNGYFTGLIARVTIGDSGTPDTPVIGFEFATGNLWVYEEIHFKVQHGIIRADDGTAANGYNMTIQAGDPDGATNDGGSVTLKAGNAILADGSSIPGGIYLDPGNQYSTNNYHPVWLGSSVSTATAFEISAEGIEDNIHIAIGPKGTGQFRTLSSTNHLYNSQFIHIGSAAEWRTASTYSLEIHGGDGNTDQSGQDTTVRGGAGNGTGDGGNLYLYPGAAGIMGIIGDIFIGTGSSGYLVNDDDETNIVAYDTATGKLTYRSAASIAGIAGDVSWGSADQPQIVLGSASGDIESSAGFTYNTADAIMKIEGGSGDLPELYLRNAAGSHFRMHMIATSPPTCYLEVVHGSGKLEIIAAGGIKFPDYGEGSITGTPTYALNVDTDGNIIEGAVAGSGISFGSDNEIPYSNVGEDDFDYSPKFTFDGNSLTIAQTTAGTAGTLNITHSNNGTEGSICLLSLNVSGGGTTNLASYTDAQSGTIGGVTKAGASILYAGTDSTRMGIVIDGDKSIYFSANNVVALEINDSGTFTIGAIRSFANGATVAVMHGANDDGVRITMTIVDASGYATIYAYDDNDGIPSPDFADLYLGGNVLTRGIIIDGPTGYTRMLIPEATQNYAMLCDSDGNITRTTSSGSSSQFLAGDGVWRSVEGTASNPGGSDEHVQWNDNGSFAGSADFRWEDNTWLNINQGTRDTSERLHIKNDTNYTYAQLIRLTSTYAHGLWIKASGQSGSTYGLAIQRNVPSSTEYLMGVVLDGRTFIRGYSAAYTLLIQQYTSTGHGLEIDMTAYTSGSYYAINVYESTDTTAFTVKGDGDTYIRGNVGIGASVSGTYELYVGGDIYATGDIFGNSDIRYKNVLGDIPFHWDDYMDIETIRYTRKGDPVSNTVFGFSAQQMNQAWKEVVTYDPELERYGIAHNGIIAINTVAIKKVKTEVDKLKKRVRYLENELHNLKYAR